ncbi:MAG TPA: acylphosphatase [Chitinophagaceae bacterium]|nr:acylphosphatase [Chitinophagaceae bacterium]
MLQTISITVSGKVQGVFFRQSTKEKAQQLGITGQVKNRPDDTVHILATGTKQQLDELVSWCGHGPPKASVTAVLLKEQTLQSFKGFTIERS